MILWHKAGLFDSQDLAVRNNQQVKLASPCVHDMHVKNLTLLTRDSTMFLITPCQWWVHSTGHSAPNNDTQI